MSSVYVMRSDSGLVKIGISKNPASRQRQLKSASGFEIDLAHVVASKKASAVERAAHTLLQDHRKSGEWFDVTLDDAIRAIERAVELIGNADPISHPNDTKGRREGIGLRQTEFAAICSIRPETLSRIENGKDSVPGYIDMILSLLERDEAAVRFAMERRGL